MESLKKILPAFDTFLIGGLGCGVLTLCILAGAFVYIWQTQSAPPVSAMPTEVAVTVLPTMTPPLSDVPTMTLAPTLIPTLEGSPALTPLPSFIPDFGGESS